MEVVSKELHRHALPIALGLILLLFASGAAILNPNQTEKAIGSLNKSAVRFKKSSGNNGLVTLQLADRSETENLNEIGRAADYYFMFR